MLSPTIQTSPGSNIVRHGLLDIKFDRSVVIILVDGTEIHIGIRPKIFLSLHGGHPLSLHGHEIIFVDGLLLDWVLSLQTLDLHVGVVFEDRVEISFEYGVGLGSTILPACPIELGVVDLKSLIDVRVGLSCSHRSHILVLSLSSAIS